MEHFAKKTTLSVLLSTTVVALTGCGGNNATPIADSFGNLVDVASGIDSGQSAIDGTVTDGPPLSNALVLATDASGRTATATTDADGYYRVKVTGFTAPLVVKAMAQNGKRYVSAREDALVLGKFTTVNVSSMTDKMSSDLAVSAGKRSAVELTPAQVVAGAASMAQAKASLTSVLGSALSAAGVITGSFDIVKTPFRADGTGSSRVLNQLRHETESTGASQLYSKIPVTDAITGEITSPPLSATNALPPINGGELDLPRLKSLQTRLTNCMKQPAASRVWPLAAGVPCTGMVHDAYLYSSMDFTEHLAQSSGQKYFNVVKSSADVMLNAVFEVPEVLALFTTVAGSTDPADFDFATIELRWFQPVDGSYRSVITAARRFPAYLNPKEANGASAIGGGWWIYGSQRAYDVNVLPALQQAININPNAGGAGQSAPASFNQSSISFFVGTQKFDIPSRQWLPANLTAARVTGPGLPANGILLAPVVDAGGTACLDANAVSTPVTGGRSTTEAAYMGIYGKNLAAVPAPGVSVATNSTDYRLGKTAPGSGAALALPAAKADANEASVDYARLKAHTLYRFTLYTSAGGTVTTNVRNVGGVLEPATLDAALPLHDLSPGDSAYLAAPKAAVASIGLAWVNNALAPAAQWIGMSSQESGLAGAPLPSVRTAFVHNLLLARARNSAESASAASFTAATASGYRGCNLPASNALAAGNLNSNGSSSTEREISLRTFANRNLVTQSRAWRN